MRNDMVKNRYFMSLFNKLLMILLGIYLMAVCNPSAKAFSNETTAKLDNSHSKSGMASLRIDLLIDKRKYNLTDSIAFKVLLTNTSNVDSVYLFNDLDLGESSSLIMSVRNSVTGREVPTTFLFDALPPPPRSKQDFVCLSPNYIYGVSYVVSLYQLGITKSGIYRLTAKYHSPVSSKMGFKFPVWTGEMGAIESNPVIIKVIN